MAWRLLALFLLLTALSSLGAQDPPPPPVQAPPDAMRDLLILKINPLYPPLARQARIQGTVILKIVVTKSGDVRNLQLVSGHPMLAPAAIEAVKQWRYKPYVLNGEPVDVETAVQVIFRMADKPAAQGVVGDNPGLNNPGLNNPGPENTGVSNSGNAPAGDKGAAFSGIISPAPGNTVPTGSQFVQVSEGVMRSFRSRSIYPDYPPSAIQARIQGTVILNVRIDKSGDPIEVQLISGHPIFVQAAIDAVKQWKYRPYLLNGEPADVETMVRLNFTLPVDQPGDGVVADAPLIPDGPPASPGSGLPQRIRVSAGVESGLLISKVAPVYPPDAREQSIQGVVILKANIDKEGNVYRIELISGYPMLVPAAIDAVKQWKYRPFLLNGNPVEVETQVQVNFTLSRR